MHCTECTTAGLRRCLTQLGLCPPLTSTLDQSSIIQSKTLHTALLDICHCTHAIFDQCLPLFGGFAAQHTILHIWNYIGALLLAAAHSRPYPGPRHLRALVIGTKMGAYMCECVWVTVWIKRRSDFTEKLHVRFENDIRSINCCWQSNGTQASVKIEKFSLAWRWAN